MAAQGEDEFSPLQLSFIREIYKEKEPRLLVKLLDPSILEGSIFVTHDICGMFGGHDIMTTVWYEQETCIAS